MEIRLQAKSDTANEGVKKLTCWDTASNPQCLCVETTSEIHLFPYGYFQYAKLSHEDKKIVLQLHFHEQIVVVKGTGLEPLFAALERLSVEKIRLMPDRYRGLSKSEGAIEAVEITATTKTSTP